jgi:hypothetical protein
MIRLTYNGMSAEYPTIEAALEPLRECLTIEAALEPLRECLTDGMERY